MNISRTDNALFLVILILSILFLCSCKSTKKDSNLEQDKFHILIVDGFSNHDWKQTTLLVKRILENSELFSVDVSTAPSAKDTSDWNIWRPGFADYDVVVQNCNSYSGRPRWPDEVQLELEKYVSNGGGLYILHSANNAFPEWNEYNRMIGLGWRKKDFGRAITIDSAGTIIRIPAGQGGDTSHGKRIDAVLTRLGDHPIHRDFPQRWKVADLEVYRYARGPAENLTVISYARDPQTQLNFPIEWVVNYGDGKVYNSTFGHVWKGSVNPPGMRCMAFQTILIRAIEWLGTGETTWSVPHNFPADQNVELQEEE